jgi:hypothetical protein
MSVPEFGANNHGILGTKERTVKPLLSIVLPAFLLVGGLHSLARTAGAQAAQRFNQIVGEMEESYYSCSRVKGKAARKRAYIEHGKKEAATWEEFLGQYGDSRQAFPARLYLAKAYDMAKEKARAKEVMSKAVVDANNLIRMKQVAEALQKVYASNTEPTQFIKNSLAKLDDPENKAELHLEMLNYLDVPKSTRRKEKNVVRRKLHTEVVTAVAKLYPKTGAGREAALMVRGLSLKVGDPVINLSFYQDEAGKPIDLDAYKGKVVLLLFWTGRRKAERFLGRMVDVYKELHPKGLEVVGVNCDYAEDHERNMLRMIEQLAIPWRNYHDGEKLRNRIALIYYVKRFPYNVVIGRDGKVAGLGVDPDEVSEMLAELVGKA